MGGKERLATRQRREVYYGLRQGTLSRRQPTQQELDSFFRAVDFKDLNAFGVRSLAELDLDVLCDLPPVHTSLRSHNAGFERSLTLIAYTAWRRRFHMLKQLLVAGASATVSDRAPEGALAAAEEVELDAMLSRRHGNGVDSRTAAHIVESIVRMRTRAARDVALGAILPPCGACQHEGLTVCFDPCGCVVCERCVWRAVLQPPRGRVRGEVCCPKCAETVPSRGHGSEDAPADDADDDNADNTAPVPKARADVVSAAQTKSPAHEATASAIAAAERPILFGDWHCECCLYTNFAARPACRNCNGTRPPAERPPPPSLAPPGATVKPPRSGDLDGGPAHEAADETVTESASSEGGVVLVEMLVVRRRAIGKQLIFLIGNDPVIAASTETSALPPPWRAAAPTQLQLVLDRAFVGRGEEAEMALHFAIPGERVRVEGTVHTVLDDNDSTQWEVRATSANLLRPRIRLVPTAPPALPSTSKENARPPKPKYRSLPPRAAAIAMLKGLPNEIRMDKAVDAASGGDVVRLDALRTLNFDLSSVLDSYGQTALILAATHGHTDAVRLLLSSKADPHVAAHGGVTAASAAAANGHGEVLAALAGAGADLGAQGSEGLAPIEYTMRRAHSAKLLPGVPLAPSATGAQLVRLIPTDAAHPGAGSCYIDNGVPEAALVALEALYARLPIHPRGRCSQGMSDRAYFCDAEGWASALLSNACAAGAASATAAGEVSTREAALPCAGEAVAHMRFLIYAEAGGGLPPHTDLSRTRRDGVTSRCTFLLYLTDCAAGGHTVLLDKLPNEEHTKRGQSEAPPSVLAAVTPKRGRLLLFPHLCPHRADEVVAEGLPKILLRGEIV